MFFEGQAKTNSCFIHATNNFFQREYINPSFLPEYSKLVLKFSDQIDQLKQTEAPNAFYGGVDFVPSDPSKLVEDKSAPEEDEDLYSYFEIYRCNSAKDFLEDISANEVTELNPTQCLFLLQYRMEETASGPELKFVPMRFHHRYARSSSEEDKTSSKKRWLDLISSSGEKESKGVKEIFLNRIEVGKAHAYSAVKREKVEKEGEGEADKERKEVWYLCDSLRQGAVELEKEEEMWREEYGGKASVLILPDLSRPSLSFPLK
eukprot:TRINITY_DN3642_c0_g1_i1.p1 TRINITY_DN3642_c0_g1~~TRINITY_DN3642_c0_g1_i1.p1  ORF type:complete len:270 (-),score=106.28 TRINITY_DN3642_c0_g1_i1:178-963(-)